MTKHNDQYIEQYCEPHEKICINCGSIFAGYVRRGMGHSNYNMQAHLQTARDNEECYPPQPQPKLKPGVQPWKPQ